MGIIFTKKDNKCYYCAKVIKNVELTRCIRCNLKMHYKCWHDESNKNYTKCKNCRRIGCIGIKQEVIDYYGLNCCNMKLCNNLKN